MQLQLKNLNNTTALMHLHGSLIEQYHLPDVLTKVASNTTPQTINFIIDLQHITGINSSGLNLLLQVLTKTRNAGGETILINLPPTLHNLLIVTKLNSIFTIAHSLEQAIEMLGQTTHIQ
ncbi:anti-sigma factor antagonist [Sphingobacteriales bacterium UPWRP_1]|nr:hypothetical protein B6N25_09100 [Sphingobacteriales bacterium TSM_CSS]PSJ77655.1 anti-sigma factor antagonist [Sphingobacteriales bacterium UPWRP_1]